MLASESLDAPWCQLPFFMELILAELEGGRYVGLILPTSLGDLVSKASNRGGSGSSGSGATAAKRKSSNTGGRAWVRYNAHLTALSLWDRENLCSILAGMVLLTLHSAVLCKNWHW